MKRSRLIDELFWGFEVHAPDKIKNAIDGGLSMTELIDGKRPIDILIQMYLRSDRLGQCLQLLLNTGATFEDPALLATLMDDADRLESLLKQDPSITERRYTFPCAFVPLEEASLLHISAEYGRRECTSVLLEYGMSTEVCSGIDKTGYGGQTPIFHTVNSNGNYCRPVMDILLGYGASLDGHLKGIVWGKGMEWETLIPEINPVSFAMMGNLPQFHRNEEEIADNIRVLQKYKYGEDHHMHNVPNAYLDRSKKRTV